MESIHEDRRVTKQRFGVTFSKVWDKAATPANIKAGFEATGSYPFTAERILIEAYASSIPTHNSILPACLSLDNDNTDSTDVSKSLLTEHHPFPDNNDDSLMPDQRPDLNDSGNATLAERPAER